MIILSSVISLSVSSGKGRVSLWPVDGTSTIGWIPDYCFFASSIVGKLIAPNSITLRALILGHRASLMGVRLTMIHASP
jgi:hypothetical protein